MPAPRGTCEFTERQLRRHLEQYGPDSVYQTAEQCGWTAPALGKLALAIRNEGGTLDRDERERLLEGLLGTNLPDARVRKLAGVSQSTVRARRTALQSAATAQEPAPLGISADTSILRPAALRTPQGFHADGGREAAGKDRARA